MRLQTDPTVIYGIGERFDGNLKQARSGSDHAFNTYIRDGLPPTPIALPGQASLDAVMHPPAAPYLYFVARGDGIERILDQPRRPQSRRGKIPARRPLTRRSHRRVACRAESPAPPLTTDRPRPLHHARRHRWCRQEHARAVARGDRSKAAATRVWLTREPGGTPLGERLRDLLLHEPMTHVTETLLMFAARREHCDRVIWPRLDAGDWVLCDRFTDATYAYQGGGHGVAGERIAAARAVDAGRLPAGSHAAVRRSGRAWRASGSADGRDARQVRAREAGFFERVRAAYLARAAAEPARFRVIDSTRPLAAVRARARPVIVRSADERTARRRSRAAPGSRCCRGSSDLRAASRCGSARAGRMRC